MDNKDISFAPVIPLIGGFPLGAEIALGHGPAAIYSYDGFESNDEHYVKYQQENLNRDIDYIDISEEENPKHVDIAVCTPPCAGLSSFNSSSNPEMRGAGCAKNEWMYISVTDAIEKLNAKVVLVENAPSLYTGKGQPVVDKIFEIAKVHGYSLSLYKTATIYHGIPQDRRRTFAILWKSEVAPYISYYKRDKESFDDYVLSYHQSNINIDLTSTAILNDPYLDFVQYKFPNRDVRELVKESKIKSVFQLIYNNNLLDEAIDYFDKSGNEKGLKLATHAKMKLADGGNIWDSSVNVYDGAIGALTGRNMTSTLHPSEDRSLSVGECLHIMGFPADFELIGGKRNMNHIAQNVPTCTARDMVLEAVKFINGELEMSESDFVKQNNNKEIVEYESKSHEQTIVLF